MPALDLQDSQTASEDPPTLAALPDQPRAEALPITATVAVPLFNHAAFIEDRLESLFAQWQPGLELLVVDDASTDGGFAIAERTLARHPHIIATLVRNGANLGAGVLSVVLRLARGAVIIQADSDDLALPGRLAATLACFQADPDCRLVTSNAVLIAADGFPVRLHDTDHPDEVFTDPRTAAEREGDQRWLGATVAFHRSLFTDLPPIDPEACPYGLDLLLPLRALLLGSHHYLSRPLVGWRQHGRNTHRMEGAQATSLPDMERYQALEVMVHRQKLRDAEHALGLPGGKPMLAEVVDLCRLRFLEKYDSWSRLRNAMVITAPMAQPASAQRPFPAMPPVVSLAAGERLAFGSAFGGVLANAWSGFNDPEAWGVWTRRHALICFRVATPDVTALRVEVGGLAFLGRQRIGLSLGLGAWLETELDGQERRLVDLPVTGAGIVWLHIHARDAALPPSADPRLLGVGVFSVTAIGPAPC